MIYTLSIDWLSLFCLYIPVGVETWTPEKLHLGDLFNESYKVKKQPCGTRQFSELYSIAIANQVSGWDDFAEVQASPYDRNILPKQAIIVRFVNRVLYMPDFWERAEEFMQLNRFAFKSISRIDICADFNQFATIDPKSLIEKFAAKALRHVGRGVGALYFDHGVQNGDYGVRYTGLSFGTHASDARVYLYNKTFELDTQKDKPYIKDMWIKAGLDIRHVWRLEVSIKSKACKFKDRKSGEEIKVDTQAVCDIGGLDKIYHTFINKLFSFVKNPMQQKNITREPRIKLFENAPAFDRCAIRNLSCSTRTERILLKALYQLGARYRGADIADIAETAQAFAFSLAESTDLAGWMARKIASWEKPTHK